MDTAFLMRIGGSSEVALLQSLAPQEGIEGSKVLMFHAKDDPNVPYERTRLFAEHTGATLKSLMRGGNIGTDYVVRRYWVQIKNFFESV